MTVKRWVVRRKSDGLYSFSAHGWTPDITLAGFFQDEHLAHLAVDKIKDVIPVLVTIEEMHPYNQQAHRDQVEAMAKAAPPPVDGGLREAVLWFAGEMERQLRENDAKSGWQDCGRTWLAGQARTNLSEVLRLDFSEKDAIVKAAADAANFCMMIADNRTSPRDAARAPRKESEG